MSSAVNNIREQKGITEDNSYLLADSNYDILSTFRTRNHNEVMPNTPMESVMKSTDLSAETKTRGGKFTFELLAATDYQIADLKDAEINVVAQVYSTYKAEGATVDADSAAFPRLGNLALLALFENAELYLDSTLIQRNEHPGFSANNDFALRYPHSKKAQREQERYGFISDVEIGGNYSKAGSISADNSSVSWHNDAASSGATVTMIGYITQKIKLSDLFNCIDTLPPIFNHKVTVNLTRSSSSYVPAAYTAAPIAALQLVAFSQFKMCIDVYNVTDESIRQLKEYYSRPIETLYTQCKQILQPIISQPIAGQTQAFNVSVDAAYKNKLMTIAIPRYTNLQRTTIANTTTTPADVSGQQFDIILSPSNSYTYGGLRSLNVYTSNGVKLFGFDMSRDGDISTVPVGTNSLLASFDVNMTPGNPMIYNYTEVYNQYLKAREQFGQLKEEGLDYWTFLKEYCIFCIDLSCFTIASGENIRIEITTGSWLSSYNPFFVNNGSNSEYASSNLLINFYSDKVLRLLPDRRVELADVFAPKGESDLTNQA